MALFHAQRVWMLPRLPGLHGLGLLPVLSGGLLLLLGAGRALAEQSGELELPKLDELIDLSESEPKDSLREGDAQALLEDFWQQQGMEGGVEAEGQLRAPFVLPELGQPAPNDGGLQRPQQGVDRLVIYSRDQLLFVASPGRWAADFLRMGDRVREQVNELLGGEFPQRFPCLIEFYELPALPGEPISALRIRSYEKLGYRIELALRQGDGLSAISLQRALVRMVLLERIAQGALLRDPKQMPLVPDWLVTGVAEMLRFEAGKLDPALFRQALEAGSQVELAEVLGYQAQGQRDGLRRLQELGCAALVHALIQVGEGKFAHWLQQAGKDPKQQQQELVQFFVEFGLEAQELERAYQASWVQLAQSTALQRYSVVESRQVLLGNLRSLQMVDEGVSATQEGLSVAECLAQWAEAGQGADLVLLRHWQQVLLALQERVHPLFGGVVIRSRRMFQGLAAGSVSLAQAQQLWAAELREMEVIVGLMERVELRMNEYQLNFGKGDLAWVEELSQVPAFDRGRSLLPRHGLLQRRMDWAEEKRRLQQGRENLELLPLDGVEELEAVILE